MLPLGSFLWVTHTDGPLPTASVRGRRALDPTTLPLELAKHGLEVWGSIATELAPGAIITTADLLDMIDDACFPVNITEYMFCGECLSEVYNCLPRVLRSMMSLSLCHP
jgi:hypothetical protein